MRPNRLLAETYDEYIERLHDLGVMELNRGKFGIIFQHPMVDDVVVKLVADDDAYLDFVALSKKNKGNPWLPDIIDVTHVTLDDKSAAALIFMKKLEPATDKDVITGFHTLAPGADQSRFSTRTRLSYPEWLQAVRFSKGNDERVVCVFMARHFNRLDLFTRNFMMRGQQLVFNDPLTPSK
jgi:hypothetical protein